MKFARFFNVHERDMNMFLKPMYVVVDKDGDFVDACSGRMPANTLEGVMNRIAQEHPQNAPFRILRWNGETWFEVTGVS